MSELRFDGRVVLVTGSGRGLGRAYAQLFAARGASVIVNDPGVGLGGEGGDRAPAQGTADEIVQAGGKAVANFDSVATEDGARAMVGQAVAAFGRIDVVINNAGIFTARYPFESTTTQTFESVWRIHVLGSVHVIRAAWPHMKAQRYGRIVNIASHAGYLGFRGNIEYAAAKGAIHGFTRALALESRDHGISVNAVAPGAMTRPVQSFFDGAEAPAGGPFSIELVAPTVLWIAHEECTANGHVFGAVAGTTTRIEVVETQGHLERSPTPEAVRDHFEQILDQATLEASGLSFGLDAETRGMELVGRHLGTAVSSLARTGREQEGT